MKGRNKSISTQNLKEIYDFIDNFKVSNKVDERNLFILKMFFIESMSSVQISELDNPLLVSVSNHGNGKRLTDVSIRRIIKSYNLVHDRTVRDKRKTKLRNTIARQEVNKPKICGCCGSKENLELHHIIPVYLGGNNDYYNLIYLCHLCHQKMHRMIENSVLEEKLLEKK